MKNNKFINKITSITSKYLIVEFILIALFVIILEAAFLLNFNIKIPFDHWVLTILNLGVIFSITSFIKSNKARFITYLVYICVFFIVFMFDMSLFYFKSDVTSIAMLFEFGLNTMNIGFKYSLLASMDWYLWVLIVLSVSIILVLLKKATYNYQENRKFRLARISLSAVFAVVAFVSLPLLFNSYNYQILKTPQDKRLHVEKFGLLTYHTRDISKYINNQIEVVFKNETFFEVVKENLPDETLNQSSYFGSHDNQNIIMIMCETCEQYAFDPVLTPNYFRLVNNGLYFDNFYSAATRNYTYDAEFKSLTSMMYFDNDNYMHTFGDNTYYNALPYQLRNAGYTTNAFHNYKGDFFNRKTLFPNLGFENFYAEEDMEFSETDYWPLDSEMFSQMIDLIVPIQDTPFYSYILTVTPHGPHNNYRSELESYYETIYNYVDENDDLPETSPLYMLKMRNLNDETNLFEQQMLTLLAAQMNFDEGLGILLDDLEEKDLLDETTIILYSDHKNYSSLDLTFMSTPNSDIYYEVDKVQMVISSDILPKGTNDTLASHYDLTPTILDLLGINYIPEFYWGQSLFSDNRVDKPIILSHSNWISEEMVVVSDFDVYNEDEDNSHVLAKKEEISKTIELYHAFFKSNYFSDLELFLEK